jgi:hypothetical protein
VSSIQDFESKLSGEFAGAHLRAVQRDYPDLVRHIEAMKQTLKDRNRGSVQLACYEDDKEAVVFLLRGVGRDLELRWVITHNALIWQRASGTLEYPLLTVEYWQHRARDVFIGALNSDVAALVNG